MIRRIGVRAEPLKKLGRADVDACSAFGKMSRFGTFVNLLRTLRTIAASTVAVAFGLTRMITKGHADQRPELKQGDVAPDFTLAASDGRTYRLAELLGHGVIVIAWFPKAFTGG